MTMNEPMGGPPGPQGGAPGDGPNVLRQYYAVLRRRWKWIALGIIVGLAAGYASTLLQKETRDPHELLQGDPHPHRQRLERRRELGRCPNLQQAAFLVHSADVVNERRPADGLAAEHGQEQVSALARSDVLAIDVTAISTDPAQAVHSPTPPPPC